AHFPGAKTECRATNHDGFRSRSGTTGEHYPMLRGRDLVARFTGQIGIKELSEGERLERIAGLRATEHTSDFRSDEGTCPRYRATSRVQTLQPSTIGNLAVRV